MSDSVVPPAPAAPATGVEADEVAPPVDSGKSSNRRKPPPRPAGALGQQASARPLAGKVSTSIDTRFHLRTWALLPHRPKPGQAAASAEPYAASGRRAGETQAADAGAQRAAHRHDVRHAATTTKDAGAAS